jgi:Tfp pilus assembly protein FimT
MNYPRKGVTIVEMAIVIFLMSLLLSIVFSLVQNFSIFKTTEGEAGILKDMYSLAKRTAIKSGQIIYMEFDLDENRYIIYRKIRNKELENQPIVERKLFITNRIIYIKTFSGQRIDSGKLTINFYPQGFNDEIYIYFGSENNIKNTVIYPRYDKYAIIKKGEYLQEETYEKLLEEDKGKEF